MDYQSFMDYQMHQAWLANQSHLYQSQFQYDHGNVSLAFDGLDSRVCRSPIRSTIQVEKVKTKLCCHFRKGGDLVCPYESKYTEEFHQLKEGISEKVQKLHRLKKVSTDSKLIQALDNQINTMIRQWNQFCPKAPNYYDLHGMTSRGAVEYVLDIVQLMRVNGVRTSWLETGKGKHSLDNIPAIKTILLRDYHGVNGCYFVPLSSNDGVLELTVI
ncbi:hypothetical protein B9Z55_012562 [Caenorhabditis nigoni]|uniref:Smr domain-containing protein n=1 Tax=Caenorhabditis nigoni TaxID=1611254 RepID=A0A2G5TXX2_9PELO|nr:hypothetical protein B9Z55_012562 [Caenorhabditis nigoni]